MSEEEISEVRTFHVMLGPDDIKDLKFIQGICGGGTISAAIRACIRAARRVYDSKKD